MDDKQQGRKNNGRFVRIHHPKMQGWQVFPLKVRMPAYFFLRTFPVKPFLINDMEIIFP